MLDHDLLARCRTMLADEASRLSGEALQLPGSGIDLTMMDVLHAQTRTMTRTVAAEACDYAADALSNVLSKADAFLDDEQAREALKG
jgi:hypothetical protein